MIPDDMDIKIQPMSLREYAELQTQFGVKIVCHQGRYWRQVRPLFYRPLLPVEGYDATAMPPPVTWPGGFQYVVTHGQEANSTMNFLMLDDPQSYSVGGLTHKRRQLINGAAKEFKVRLLKDPAELKAQGHKVYLSFYERTRYPFKSDRQDKVVFDRWVDTLFANPKAILLGGFGPDGLAAILVLSWVNHTLICSTLICETEAMRKKLGELMFHSARVVAAQEPGVREIFVRSYQGGNSLDNYYLLRGCRLVKKPARLEISSSIQTLIRWVMPRKYELLCGDD